MNRDGIKILIAYILVCLIWGSTWLVIRIGLDSLTPFVSSGLRFIIASGIIYSIMKIKGIKLQTDKNSMNIYLLMTFFSYVLPFGFVYWGEQYIPSGLASVLFAGYPFFVAIISFFALPDEKINTTKIIAIILGFGGILVIFSENLSFDLNYNLIAMIAVFLSGLMQAGIAVGIKKHGNSLNPLSMNFLPMLIAGIILLIFGYAVEDISKLDFNFAAVSSILFLAVFGSVVTFTAYYWLLKKINIILLALTSFITPVVAVLMGYIFLSEKLTQRHLAGSILVLCGILFANLGGTFFLGLQNRFRPKKNGNF